MSKKLLIIALLITLLAPPAIAALKGVTLTATGYEWLGYSPEQKNIFVGLAYHMLDIDKSKYKPADTIKAIDDFYYDGIKKAKADPLHVNEDNFLRVRCISIISNKVQR